MKSLATLGNELYSAKTSIPFVQRRRIWYLIAVVVIAGSAALLGAVGLTPGIDFKGGSEITVTGLSSPSERPANDVLSKDDLTAGSSVTTMGSSSVRVQTSQLSKDRLDSLAGELATAYKTDASNVSATTVGPTWSSDVTKKAARGLVLFFIFVGLLIWAYFRTWKMAAAALLALCHDIVVTVGIYALSGFEVTPATIIGVLTILGYSLYDTVVVFDKVRENTTDITKQGRTFSQAANSAINDVLVRSINTTLLGVLPVLALLIAGVVFMGGDGPLADLGLALLLGMVTGAYSSIFIATPLFSQLREHQPDMVKHRAALANRAKRSRTRVTIATTEVDGTVSAATVSEDSAPFTTDEERPRTDDGERTRADERKSRADERKARGTGGGRSGSSGKQGRTRRSGGSGLDRRNSAGRAQPTRTTRSQRKK